MLNLKFFLFRDRSIYMGIWVREICNGTAGYFDPLFERGHGLFRSFNLLVISMLFFNGARDYFQVLRYGAMDYFQWCQLYGTNNYFSIFSQTLYGTKDYFPDFSTGPMIFLPFLKKFSRFLEPYCQSLKWV